MEHFIEGGNLMPPKKPSLTVVDSSATVKGPPSSLGEPGRSLWNRIMAAYEISDEGGLELLFQACAAADRAEALRMLVERDGEILSTKHGLKDHPALKHELAARSFVCRTLIRLGLDVEPLRAGVGRPGKDQGWRA